MRRTWWPPFYATDFFLPKVRVRLTNRGARLGHGASLQLDIREYAGPIGEAPPLKEGWSDALHVDMVDQPWEPDEKRRFTLRVPSRSLPRPGTYILRLSVAGWEPLGTLRQQHERIGAEDRTDYPPGVREAQQANRERVWREAGIDPDRPQQGFGGKALDQWVLGDYFRVEALSAVLQFGLVTVTLLLVLATLD